MAFFLKSDTGPVKAKAQPAVSALRSPKRTIAGKLSLLVLVSVATAAVTMSAFLLWFELDRYAQTKAQALFGAAQTFASAAAPAVARGDTDGARQAIKAISRIPHLDYAEIRSASGLLLAELGRATQLDSRLLMIDETNPRINPFDLLWIRTIDVRAPIVESGARVGSIVLVADLSDLLEQLLASLRGVGVGAGIAAMLGLLVAARQQRDLTRPLLTSR